MINQERQRGGTLTNLHRVCGANILHRVFDEATNLHRLPLILRNFLTHTCARTQIHRHSLHIYLYIYIYILHHKYIYICLSTNIYDLRYQSTSGGSCHYHLRQDTHSPTSGRTISLPTSGRTIQAIGHRTSLTSL